MAEQPTPQERWSTQTTVPMTPRDRVIALVKSPLGVNAWSNPLRMGAFTIHDFWDVRGDIAFRYKTTWPTEPVQLAQLMLDTGLRANEIDIALRVERTERSQDFTTGLQMHRYLREHHGLSTQHDDALGALATIFEASSGMGLGQSDALAALRSHMQRSDHWENVLHALTQYDNSPLAQNAYLATIEEALMPAPVKNAPPTGALPLRGRYRQQSNDSFYQHGWDSTGSAMVQALPQADNAALSRFLHARHDLHGLGAMVVQERLSLSEFLNLVTSPSPAPLPAKTNTRGEDTPPDTFRRESIVEVVHALVDMLPRNVVRDETRKAMAANPMLPDALQGMVAPPTQDSGISNWWGWNLRLTSMGLVDPSTPSAQMEDHLLQVKNRLPDSPKKTEGLKYMQAKDFDGDFARFASSHPVLSNMALALLMHSIPNHSKPTDIWDKMKTSDVSWLHKADCARFIAPVALDTPSYGEPRVLPFAAMFLPHMSDADKARLAPMVAYGVGVNSIKSLSPKTLRSMWSEHHPDAFRASIPTHYAGDTYILFALTRKNADDLMSTLSSMDVRHDIPSYLQCVETWTRQAMKLPPVIDDIGPTEHLFGV